jgi:hypothetical protein
MTWVILRVLIFVVLGAAIFLGVRRIWRDWRNQFKAQDKADADARLTRDRTERARPDVITLERGKDGTFRKPGDDQGGA